jgi:thiopeptide-type bacteriocin biosynthesis protein
MQETTCKDFGKVIIRTPLYSYQRLFNPEGKTLELDDVVLQLLEDPVFIESIYWSSPQLHQTVLDFKNGETSSSKKSKLLDTLKKYAIRASTRCTPYGIYAGCAVAEIGINEKSTSEIKERIVRIDIGLLQQIIRQLETDNAIWPHLCYHINNSLYSLPNHYRFLESIVEGGKRQYQVSSIDRTDLLEEIFELSKNELISVDNIFALMPKEVGYEESKEFVKGLIDTQFLVSELRLGLTIEDELGRIQKILKRLMKQGIGEIAKYVDLFSFISNILEQFKKLPIGILPLKEIKGLENILDKFGIEVTQSHLFHADLKQPILSDCYFPKTDLNELNKAIIILGKLSANIPSHETPLGRFKTLFKEKYATREIPLAEALDAEFGIGFPPIDGIGNIVHNSLIEQLDAVSKNTGKMGAGKSHPWLQHKIENLSPEIFKKGLLISDKDLEGFTDKSDQLANHFAVMGTLLPFGYTLLQSVGGAHANALLGRFGYMGDEIKNLCKEIADTEAKTNEEVIFAEIIHIPDGRSGNIARRPILSKYEIPYLASSTLDVQNHLHIEDLLVSIQQDEIVLRSKKWNTRVVPRLSNAHNYINSTVSIYKFLAAIQHQGVPGFEINWAMDTNTKCFLPRLTYRKFILHPACWFLREPDINKITQAENPLIMLRLFFKNWHVPRFVCFTQGDNELFIDTSNDSYLLLLLKEIKAYRLVKLVEWLHGDAINHDAKEQLTIQQFILPLSKKNLVSIRPAKGHEENQNIRRTFEPGSEWLYFKIYCGAYVSDDILLKVINPIINLLLKEGVISKGFFIRYTDPHYHIRLRLHLTDYANGEQYATSISHVYNLLHPFVANGTVWKLQMDTYEREIERYGADEILKSEELFFHDSSLFLTCLEDEIFVEDQQTRFLSALKNIDAWLSLFNMSLDEKADFCEKMSDAFAQEFASKVKLQLDLQYRNWKPLIKPFLTGNKYDFAFGNRDEALKKLPLKIENLSSYIHMSINRWFATEQRLLEYMAYLFCGKYYNQLMYHTNAGQ